MSPNYLDRIVQTANTNNANNTDSTQYEMWTVEELQVSPQEVIEHMHILFESLQDVLPFINGQISSILDFSGLSLITLTGLSMLNIIRESGVNPFNVYNIISRIVEHYLNLGRDLAYLIPDFDI